MNLWECAEPNCKRVCYGTGGAIGLTSIGWCVQIRTGPVLQGPLLLCPAHHPDGMDVADRQAELIQFTMSETAI